MAKLNKKTRNLLINLSFVAVLIVVTMVVLFVNMKKELNLNDVLGYFKNSNPVWIVAAFLCMLLFIVFEGISLYFISRCFGHRPKVVSSFAYASADAFYSAITPTAAGGQPAAVFYMARDGMGAGKASFAMLLNVIGYTASIFVIGLVAICINPSLFGGIDTVFSKVLVISGGVIQAVLLGFFIGCMYFGQFIIKVGNGLVTLLTKIRLVKNPDKWRNKINYEVNKYRECRRILKGKPAIILPTLLFNIAQRVSQTLIPCFVFLAIDPDISFVNVFVLQAFVLFGYNAIPIPGGLGAYEYLFINVYTQMFPKEAIMLALMISRLFSFYLSMVLSGVVTLTYHIVSGKQHEKAAERAAEQAAAPEGEASPTDGDDPAEDTPAVEENQPEDTAEESE